MVSMEVETNSEETKENSKRNLSKTILDNFSNLVKPHEGVRVKSSVNLLKYLCDNESDKVNEKNYALGRIIRGLGSSSASARTGFYTVLVAAINFHDVNIDTIFSFIEKELHKAGSNAKSENADIATGQILACGAIIRSRLWTTSSMEQKQKIFSIIIKASKERVYLGLLANNFLINSFEILSEKQFQKLFPLIKDEITKPWNEHTIDTLYLLNAIGNKYTSVINEKFLYENLGIKNLISDESFEKLSNILLDIPRLESLKHPFYNIISKEIAANDLLREFARGFDPQLGTRNRNRLLAAIKIYTNILEAVIKTSHIPALLSKNFIQHILNYFKNVKDDYEFQKGMHNFFETLLATLKKDQVKSKTKISVLKKFLFYPGTFIFEKITKSKIIQHVTSSLDNDGVKNLAVLYRGVVNGSERIDSQDEHWLNNDRLYAAHLLVKLLNLPAVKEENDWKVEQLCFLVDLGLFKGESEGIVGSELAGSLKTTFYGALNLKLSKLDDLVHILLKLFNHIDSKLNSDNLETVLRNPISEETYDLWQTTAHRIAKIEKKRKRHASLKTVFITLFLQMGLQLFNDTKLATDSLNELFACYEKSRKSRKDSVNSLDETSATAEESKLEDGKDPIWIEVVVDLFLNLLSHNSHLLRHLVNCVFPHLCEYMTPTAIHQILSVLDPKNEDNPLSKRNNESSDDDDESDNEDDENDPDEKEDTDSGEEEEDEDSESEDENADEDYDDDDGDKETVNERLRMALHEALSKNGGYQTDEESIDVDNLGETEGKELDKALADAFRQFKPNRGKHKKQSKDEETLTHFRIRSLDLIEIFLNSNPSMQLSLEIMLPLLQAVEFSIRDDHQIPLHNRLKSTLKKLTNVKKFSDTDGVDDVVLSDLLRSLLEKGTKTTWIVQDMRVEIAQCCTFIIRCSDVLTSLETTPKKVKKKLKNSLTEIILSELYNFFHKRDSLTPIVLFKNVLGLSWDGCISMVPPLLQYTFDEEVKPFKRNQAAELLRIFYQNQRFLSISKEKITEALQDQHKQFSDNVINLFTNSSENVNIKEKFVCNLFHLIACIKTSCLNVDNINWKQIGETIREYRSGVALSNDTKKAFNKCANRLGVSNVVKMKPKTVKLSGTSEQKSNKTADNEEALNAKKKIKKTKDKEKLKLKKEAKQIRMQSLSEGLGDTNFSEVDAVKIREDENKEEENGIAENPQNSGSDEEDIDINKKQLKKQKSRKRKNSETGNDEASGNVISKSKKNKFQQR